MPDEAPDKVEKEDQVKIYCQALRDMRPVRQFLLEQASAGCKASVLVMVFGPKSSGKTQFICQAMAAMTAINPFRPTPRHPQIKEELVASLLGGHKRLHLELKNHSGVEPTGLYEYDVYNHVLAKNIFRFNSLLTMGWIGAVLATTSSIVALAHVLAPTTVSWRSVTLAGLCFTVSSALFMLGRFWSTRYPPGIRGKDRICVVFQNAPGEVIESAEGKEGVETELHSLSVPFSCAFVSLSNPLLRDEDRKRTYESVERIAEPMCDEELSIRQVLAVTNHSKVVESVNALDLADDHRDLIPVLTVNSVKNASQKYNYLYSLVSRDDFDKPEQPENSLHLELEYDAGREDSLERPCKSPSVVNRRLSILRDLFVQNLPDLEEVPSDQAAIKAFEAWDAGRLPDIHGEKQAFDLAKFEIAAREGPSKNAILRVYQLTLMAFDEAVKAEWSKFIAEAVHLSLKRQQAMAGSPAPAPASEPTPDLAPATTAGRLPDERDKSV